MLNIIMIAGEKKVTETSSEAYAGTIRTIYAKSLPLH